MSKPHPPATQSAIDAGKRDAEMMECMSALENAMRQAQRGESAAVHTPEAIAQRWLPPTHAKQPHALE